MGCLPFLFLVWVPSLVVSQSQIRICVEKEVGEMYCSEMEAASNFKCVLGRDKMDCMKKVSRGEADIMEVDEQDVYVAGKFHRLSPVALQLYHHRPYRYEGVALVSPNLEVSSLADLQGKRSCHTGVGRTVGWQVPIGLLQARGVMPASPDGELASVASFFSASCAPGNWSRDPQVDRELKKRFPNLCRLCSDPSKCGGESEIYQGYSGALRCLNDGVGDIAFSKMDALTNYLEQNPQAASNMNYFCLDGSKRTLEQGPCVWSARPSPAFISREIDSEDEKQSYLQELERVFSQHGVTRPTWFNKVFVSNGDKITGFRSTIGKNYQAYLGDYIHTIEKPTYYTAKWCTTSDKALEKCNDFSQAAYGRRLRPVLECVRVNSVAACMEQMSQGNVDLVTMDGGDIYVGGRYYGLRPLSAETYGETNNSYYAVAVVKRNSDINSLADLRGKRTCHTGILRTAGWIMPIGSMLDLGLLPYEECDRAKALANYVSGACVPGANDITLNPNLESAEKLCSQCIGDSQGRNKCSRSSAERYSGYGGAFRCLAEDAGDVAFVKHTTVFEYSDGKSQEPWTNGLHSENFRLLCRQSGSTMSPDKYKECNLASSPAHHVMTNGNKTSNERLCLTAFLADACFRFSKESEHFKLFAPYEGVSDLLFKDYVTSLHSVPLEASYRDVLGENFFKASESADPRLCQQESI